MDEFYTEVKKIIEVASDLEEDAIQHPEKYEYGLSSNSEDPIYSAISYHDIVSLLSIIQNDPDSIHIAGGTYRSPLQYAIDRFLSTKKNKPLLFTIVKILIEHGSDLNTTQPIKQILDIIEYHYNVDRNDDDEFNIYTVTIYDYVLVRILLENNADIALEGAKLSSILDNPFLTQEPIINEILKIVKRFEVEYLRTVIVKPQGRNDEFSINVDIRMHVSDFKKYIHFDFPYDLIARHKVMDDQRWLSDYGIYDGMVIYFSPKIRSGFGGKTRKRKNR